jgi:phage tail-like protein
VDGDGALVVARRPGSPFAVWRDAGGTWAGIEPLDAPGYDGAAIAADREGTIAYTTEGGVSRVAGSAARYRSTARLLTYRLDAGQYRARWGRIFLDACIPVGTSVRVASLTSDDDEVVDAVPARSPRGAPEAPYAELTPPLPSADAVSRLASPLDQPVFRRPTGREHAWEQIANDDGYDTFEAPVAAPPGRYLWLVVELQGTARVSPRIRELRIEQAGHRLDTQLPRMWSRDAADASFLHRFLTPADAMVRELDEKAAQRSALLDPQTAPAEALDWLASFLGIVLDRRWPVAARRDLVAEAYDLFRRRGTRAALEEVLALYLGRRVDIVENWRLRGLGGTTLGLPASGRGAPFVAEAGRAVEPLGSFIVGGVLPANDRVLADSDADTAHRFTAIMPMPLNAEQRSVVASIVETHKPAHTQADICEFGDGMRIGRSRIALTAFVAPSSGWGPDIVGQVLLGTDGVVGVPDVAARIGDAAIGSVRVG